MERSIWAGFTCATVDVADTPIEIPDGAESYDFSRFSIYIKGELNGPVLVDHERQSLAGLRVFAAPTPRRDNSGASVEIATSTDGRTVEFRSTHFDPSVQAVMRWSREHAATIEERFERLEADQDERGWIIRVHLLPDGAVTSRLPAI